MKRITALLYHDFTTLDALGPLEVLGRLPGYEIRYASLSGGPVSNEKGLVVMTEALSSPGPVISFSFPAVWEAGSWCCRMIFLPLFIRRLWSRRL